MELRNLSAAKNHSLGAEVFLKFLRELYEYPHRDTQLRAAHLTNTKPDKPIETRSDDNHPKPLLSVSSIEIGPPLGVPDLRKL